MYKQVESPRFAVCIRIVELVLLTSLTSAEHLLIHKHWTINCAIVLYCIVSIYLPAPSASHSRSLSFTLRSSNPCALFHHNSPGLLPIPLLWLAFCSPGQPKPCSSLCGRSYRSNSQIRSCVKLHAGVPSLAPHPTAHRIQGRLHGVAMPIGPIMQSRACSIVAPTVWNGLPPVLRLLPRTLSDTFYNQLKTVLFDRAGVGSTSE